jgi:hypothetical protein
MFIVLYRWRLHPGMEDSFVAAWSRITGAVDLSLSAAMEAAIAGS